MVVLDECGPDCDCLVCSDSAGQFVDHLEASKWDDEPTHEKWRRGGRWN